MIKVCGLRDSQNIREIARLGVDWIGMIFWPRSKRYVSAPPTEIPDNVRRVGVFVDASIEEVKQHISDYRLDFVPRPSTLPHPTTCYRPRPTRGLPTISFSTRKGKPLAAMGRNSTGLSSTTIRGIRPSSLVAASGRKMQRLSKRFTTPSASVSISTPVLRQNLHSRISLKSNYF